MVGVTLLPGGERFAVAAGETVLEAALRAGLPLRSSCRNGSCRACLCRCVEGRVRYRIDWPGLSAEEKHGGWVLPCVALAETDLVLAPGQSSGSGSSSGDTTSTLFAIGQPSRTGAST